MRFQKLNFIAWGPFTDVSLDLSEGEKGLHLIYGSNEAGKSSALRGLYALLFGIPARTPYSFVHDYTDLRIRAVIENSYGDKLDFLRRKGQKNTLIKPDNSPIDKNALRLFLPIGLSEKLFKTMCAIDHIALRKGGRELAEGGGEAGESLFAAGMGSGTMKAVLRSLEEEADTLFKPRAANPELNSLIKEYNEICNAIKEISISGENWKKHQQRQRELAKETGSLTTTIKKKNGEKMRLERIRNALPLLTDRKRLLDNLADFKNVPRLREGFPKERVAIEKHREQTQNKKKNTIEILSLIARKTEELNIPKQLIESEEEITELYQLAGSIKKAMKDLPSLESNRDSCRKRCTRILTDINQTVSLEEARSVCPPAQVRTRIRGMADTYQKLTTGIKEKEIRIEEISDELRESKQKLGRIPAERSSKKLNTAIKEARNQGNLENNLENLEEELTDQKERADASLESLLLWSGELYKIPLLPVPSEETINRFSAKFQKLETSRNQLEVRIEEITDNINKVQEELDSLIRQGEIPTEKDLSIARQKRQELWEKLRNILIQNNENSASLNTEKTTMDYERTVMAADSTADGLRHDADRVSKKANLQTNRAKLKKKEEEKQDALNELDKQQEILKQKWSDAWSETGLSPLPPDEMRAWRSKQQELASSALEIEKNERRAMTVRDKIKNHMNTVKESLNTVEENPPHADMSLQTLLDYAESVVDTIKNTRNNRKSLTEAMEQKESAFQKVNSKKKDQLTKLSEWRSEWSDTVQKLGLESSSEPFEANVVLDRLQDLQNELDDVDGYTERIEDIQQDKRMFENDVIELIGRLKADSSDSDPAKAIGNLKKELERARENTATLKQLNEQKTEKTEALQESEKTIKEASDDLKRLLEEANCSEPEDLPGIEQQAKNARELDRQLEDVEKELSGYCAGKPLEELISAATAIDGDVLPTEIEHLEIEIGELQEKYTQLTKEEGAEQQTMDQMDGGAEASQKAGEAEEAAASISRLARRYARLKLGSVVLRREIERYREENQGPIVERAGELFRKLTLGSFTGIRTDYDKEDTPILVAQRNSKDNLTLDELSDGSRDQLFLALRVAFLERMFRSGEPVPLILDDVLVNFDDRRSAAALKILADFSKTTQVIFFTHHQHIIELANNTLDKDSFYLLQLP